MLAAHFIICADGGANRLYDAFPQSDKMSGFLPAVIAGDMDSIRPDVQQHFTNHGSEIIDQSQDQDTTDLQKCLSQLEARFTKEKLASSTVVAAGKLLLLSLILSVNVHYDSVISAAVSLIILTAHQAYWST